MTELLHFVLAKEIGGERVIVEIWDKYNLVGCIYPHETTVAIVSKFLEDVKLDKTCPPKATISFRRT